MLLIPYKKNYLSNRSAKVTFKKISPNLEINMRSLYGKIVGLGEFLQSYLLLALRLYWGYSFFQANKLGLKSNLRGYRQDRFAGDDVVFQNTDLRLRLARFKSYFLSGDVGILGFNDFGRVWVDNEKSNEWHHGYGGGFWFAPYKLMVLTANLSHSVEEDIFSIEFKYMF